MTLKSSFIYLGADADNAEEVIALTVKTCMKINEGQASPFHPMHTNSKDWRLNTLVTVLQQLDVCWAQGKVRRMRESPFNKTSGLAKQQPAKSRMAPAPISPVKAESEEEVSPSVLQACRPTKKFSANSGSASLA